MAISMASLVAPAKAAADRLDLLVSDLTSRELEIMDRSFNRQFILQFHEREIIDMYERHRAEVLLAGMVAKKQMDAEIDGELPRPGKIGGPVPVRACYVGIGDDWEDGPGTYTTGSEQNWIHSGTSLMGGTSGNAVKIGENLVLCVFAIRSRHPSPKTESVQFTINNNENPILQTSFALNASRQGLAVKELNNAYIWKHDDTVLGKVFATTAHGSTTTDYLELIGAAYVKEPQLKLLDAADVPGTVQDVILTT